MNSSRQPPPQAFNLAEMKTEATKLGMPPNLQPVADNFIKNSGTFANFVMKQIKTNAQPPHVRARQEAQEADTVYRTAIRRADRERLALEDRIEATLKLLQRWEMERLRAVKDGEPPIRRPRLC